MPSTDNDLHVVFTREAQRLIPGKDPVTRVIALVNDEEGWATEVTIDERGYSEAVVLEVARERRRLELRRRLGGLA